jgi:pyruvate ferredoxin oxidoreductase beta subunit
MEAHDIPYVATCSISEPLDIYEKFKKAKAIKGCKYIHILATCAPGWGFQTDWTIEIARLAVETGFWILYEVENGILKLSKKSAPLIDPKRRLPIIEYVSKQKRFAGISEKTLIEIQEWVDRQWKRITTKLNCQEDFSH